MKILVCDDDKFEVIKIKKLLTEYFSRTKYNPIIDAYTNGESVYNSKNKYDIAFIDIEMPTVDGLTLTKRLKLKNKNVIIFIITSFNKYLDEAMDLEVFRYIDKPVDKDRFFRGISAAIKKYYTSTQKITLEYYDECYTVSTNDIIYITTENNKAVVITKTRRYLTNERLKSWAQRLNNVNSFAIPHHSFIVNMNYVLEFNKHELKLLCDERTYKIPVSQRGYPVFKTAFYAFIGA